METKTPEEVLQENGFDFEKFKNQNEYSAFNLINAMNAFANQQLALKKEELEIQAEIQWDNFSEYIDDDIFSLQDVAGTSVMKRADFIKAVDKIISYEPQ